jgi:flagellar FliL protein
MAEEEAEEVMTEAEGLEEQVLALQKKSKMLMILLLVALVAAIGSGVYSFISSSSNAKEIAYLKAEQEDGGSHEEQALEGIHPARKVGILHPLEPFVVNLLDPANLRYVNCRVELEVEDGATIKEIKAREAQIRDSAIDLLSNQPYEDVLGSAGKARLREEMLVRFNRVLSEGQISRVYITEFVVQ